MIILLNKNEGKNDLDEADIDLKFITEVKGIRVISINVDEDTLHRLIDIYIRDARF